MINHVTSRIENLQSLFVIHANHPMRVNDTKDLFDNNIKGLEHN